MKRGKMKHFMLKRILVLAFIISLLSNHIMILSEVTNIALATEVEWTSEFTSDVRTDEIQENENNQDEQEPPNEENTDKENNAEENNENEVIPDVQEPESEKSEEIGEDLENNNSEENNDADVSDEEVEEVKELTPEEIESFKEIAVNTNLNINKLVKFDNENGKGTLVDLTFKANVDTKGHDVNNLNINFELPNISGIMPYMCRVEEISDNINFLEEGTNRRILNINEVVDNYDEEVRLVLVYSEESISGTDIGLSGDVRLEISGYEILGNFEEHKEVEETTDVLST